MTNANTVTKREWTAPELKKVDLKQITAGGPNPGNDTPSKS
jgi:hypothetical protein